MANTDEQLLDQLVLADERIDEILGQLRQAECDLLQASYRRDQEVSDLYFTICCLFATTIILAVLAFRLAS